MKQDLRKAYLGTGLAFPMQVNSKGEIALVSGPTDIDQSIRIILGTRPGERVMRPTFGCKAHDLLFEVRDATTASLLKKYVIDALNFWEPRIQVLMVDVLIDDDMDGALQVEIDYEIKATHDTRSIVYPFFLAGEENW
ncbi:MAG: GPW/gp25 family protein [Anaerolineaceae bacterium]|nr:GPW/gp25 family protein [Anaerolineaceae bacterium]